MGEETKVICGVCKLAKSPDEVVPGQVVRAAIAASRRGESGGLNAGLLPGRSTPDAGVVPSK